MESSGSGRDRPDYCRATDEQDRESYHDKPGRTLWSLHSGANPDNRYLLNRCARFTADAPIYPSAQSFMPRARMRLSAGGLMGGVVRKAEVGASGRLLVRRRRDAKVATAG